jgi:hypothetical protein
MIEKKKDQCGFYLDYAAAAFNSSAPADWNLQVEPPHDTIGAVEGIVK